MPFGFPDKKCSEELRGLLEKAKTVVMTPAMVWEQRVSWAYGNLSLDDPRITRAVVEAVATELYGPKPEES